MRLNIAGNSHTGALADGLHSYPGLSDQVRIFPFGGGAHEILPFSKISELGVSFAEPSYAERLLAATGQTIVDPTVTWGICMGTHNSRIYRNPFWATAMPSDLATPGVRPVSKAMLHEILIRDQRYVRAFLAQLKQSNVNVFVISCPPPRRDGAAAQAGVPPQTVSYIDAKARRLFARWLDKKQIPFVPFPDETVHADGFLKEQYARKFVAEGRPDPHHANAAYGKLMIQRIIRQVGLSLA